VQPIVRAVKQGFVKLQKSPLTWFEAVGWWVTALWRNVVPANPAPRRFVPGASIPARASNEVKDGRCFGPAEEGMEP
jgi:hypothetical protein